MRQFNCIRLRLRLTLPRILLKISNMERVLTSREDTADLKALWDGLRYVQRSYFHERASMRYRQDLIRSISSPDFIPNSQRFVDDGIVILPSYFSPSVVTHMKEDFERMIHGKAENENAMIALNESTGTTLRETVSFSRASVDPVLTSLAAYYWGRPVVLAQTYGTRIEPCRKIEYGSFRWHHDVKRKQVKAMILLCDVPPDGQRMDYIPGTHGILHLYSDYDATRFTDDEVRSCRSPVRCAGPAGTVILFDTNGLHRGNRNPGPRRDVWVFQYTAGYALFPLLGLHPDVVRELNAGQKRIARIPQKMA